WGAVTGFAFGAVAAGVWGGAWGCCYGDVDIDRNVNINRSDAYNRWNNSQGRSNVESRAQSAQTRATEARQGAQQRAQSAQTRATEARQGAQQAAQQRSAASRSNDVYAGRDGNTYRRGAQGWEQNSGQGWDKANFGQGGESAGDLNRQQRARSEGSARESSFQRSGGTRPSGGYSGGGGMRGG